VEFEKVTISLRKISSDLNDIEQRREILIKGTRDVIINCSKSIMSLHRGKYQEAAILIEEAQTTLGSLRINTRNDLEKYLLSAEQEFVEARQLKCVCDKSGLFGIDELNVAASSYILGLLDCVGEIKRMIYENLRTANTENAIRLFNLMEDLHSSIYPFSVYDNIVPGIRRKLDVAKILIENVRSSITEESSRNLLIRKIDSVEKRLGEMDSN
jgi:translin